MKAETIVSKERGRGVKKIAPVDIYYVEYEGGDGNMSARLVFRPNEEVPKGTQPRVIILQERVNGALVATPASDWFAAEVNKVLDGDSPSAEQV